MRRFSKRFRTPRPSLSGDTPSRQSPTQGIRQHCTPSLAANPTLASGEDGAATDCIPLDVIAEELRVISNRIKDLKGLVNANRSTIAQVADIKRGLRDTHRMVEQFQTTRCRGLGEEVAVLAQDMTRHSWQSYKSALLLGEKLKIMESHPVSVKEEMQQFDEADAADIKEQAAKVYIPTGAQTRTNSMRRLSYRHIRIPGHVEPDLQNQAIAGTLRADMETTSVASGSTMITVRGTQYPVRRPSSASSVSSGSTSSDTKVFPQSKIDVKRQIQQEEANARFTLNESNTVRQGSCDGASIATMVMSGYQDDRLVLPNLQYIKVHELRALVEWMIETDAVTRSGSISCVEKVLHCVQLLQTGCRYESLAVIFSRSPRQIKESCLEVMGGLLQLHSATVNKVGGQEMYMPLWKIWRKFEATEGRAGAYYGFRWLDVAKVLVTLNLYIGRWRMQGMFATDGPTFLWGRFFVSHGGGAQTARKVVDSKSACETVDDGNGTSMIRAVQKMAE